MFWDVKNNEVGIALFKLNSTNINISFGNSNKIKQLPIFTLQTHKCISGN